MEAGAQLEGGGAAGTEGAAGAAGGLAEYLVQAIVAVSGEIREVENIERLAENRKLVALAPLEEFRQANVLRVEVMAEIVVGRERHGRERLIWIRAFHGGHSWRSVSRVILTY